MNSLELADDRFSTPSGWSHVDETFVQDWLVDGTPLQRLFAEADVDDDGSLPGLATMLTDAFPDAAYAYCRRLLGNEPGDFADGRVSLLVCPLDGDIDCGAISAEIAVGDELVHWTRLGWQVNYDMGEPSLWPLEPTLSFAFDRRAYDSLLRGLLSHYRSLVVRP